MGVHSASSVRQKYGLLPEFLPEGKLHGATGARTWTSSPSSAHVAGGWLCKTFAGHQGWSGVVLNRSGWSVWRLAKHPACPPLTRKKQFRINFIGDLWPAQVHPPGSRAMAGSAGNTYFFAIAALIQFLIVIYATDVLHLPTRRRASYLQAATAIGIGFGQFRGGLSIWRQNRVWSIRWLGGLDVLRRLLGRTSLICACRARPVAARFLGGFLSSPSRRCCNTVRRRR